MESEGFLPCLDQFMLSPLVTWVSNEGPVVLTVTELSNLSSWSGPPQVKTFVPGDGGAHLDFSKLLDGVLLNDIMTQM